jgi:hypothetical protein
MTKSRHFFRLVEGDPHGTHRCQLCGAERRHLPSWGVGRWAFGYRPPGGIFSRHKPRCDPDPTKREAMKQKLAAEWEAKA